MGMHYGNVGMTPEQREAQAQARQEAQQEAHDEAVADHQGESQAYQAANAQFPLTTNFHGHGLEGLKSMLAGVNPGGVRGIGENWKKVHNQLVGEDGSGTGDCAHGLLKKAVENVLEHWEGESAKQFQVEANSILREMRNAASHCTTVSQVMTQMSSNLGIQKQALDALEEPGFFESAGDFLTDTGRDDTFTQQDVREGNLPKDVIAEIEENRLSEGKEVQLKAVDVMETLARTYVGGAQRLQQPIDGTGPEIPPSTPSIPMPTPIPAFSGSSPTPGTSGGRKSWSTNPTTGNRLTPVTTGPRDVGISGGKQVPVSQTKIDSLPTGITNAGADTVPGGGTVRGTGGGGVTGPGGTGGINGGGMLGATPGGRGGTTGGARSGIRGTTPGGTSGGRGTASGGFRGMGGMGGAGGGGGRGGAASGSRGPLARAKGGVAGAAKGITGGRPATPGGTGLGRGRDGASGNGNGTRGGMLAGRMGSSQRPGDDEREQGDRPDYLVEDEETWTPEDNRSVPRTIE